MKTRSLDPPPQVRLKPAISGPVPEGLPASDKAFAKLGSANEYIMTDKDGKALALEFFDRVWTPPHELDAIDELMTPDYKITTAGREISGREAFKAWVAEMQKTVQGATNEHVEVFTNSAGDRVVSRWVTRGTNNGVFGLPADGRAIAFTGIAIWRVESGRLAQCWVERSALELFKTLGGA